MKSFRELRVWQQAMRLVEMATDLPKSFPKHENYGLMSQLQRAIVSVPSNIAEGHTREHLREYLHHISIAQASLAEVETQVELAMRQEYVQPSELKELLGEINSLGRQLYSPQKLVTDTVELSGL